MTAVKSAEALFGTLAAETRARYGADEELWRLRIGDLRGIYVIDDDGRVVVIVHVALRREHAPPTLTRRILCVDRTDRLRSDALAPADAVGIWPGMVEESSAMKRIGIMWIVVLLAAAVAAPVSGAEGRPMSGTFQASAAPAAQRCGPAALTLGFEIRGRATHLGRLSGAGTNCTEFTLATASVAIWDGIATFTAADGSTITTTSDGRQGAPANGVASFVTVHAVTGGTGRFADARGSWTVAGTIDLVAGVVAGTVSGWVSY